MHMHNNIRSLAVSLIVSAGLLAAPALTLADNALPPVPGKAYCKDNPGKCEEALAKRQEYCQANAEACKAQRMQARETRAERKAYCKDNPAVCEQQRAQMKAKKAELKAQCKADPARCEELKKEARQRWRERDRPAHQPGQH